MNNQLKFLKMKANFLILEREFPQSLRFQILNNKIEKF